MKQKFHQTLALLGTLFFILSLGCSHKAKNEPTDSDSVIVPAAYNCTESDPKNCFGKNESTGVMVADATIAALTAVAVESQKPDVKKGSVRLRCHYSQPPNEIMTACGNVTVTVSGDAVKGWSQNASGEEILIGNIPANKKVDLIVQMRGCSRPKFLSGITDKNTYEVKFELPCT